MRKVVDGPGRGQLRLGTSGFSYDAWKGGFYPADIKAKDMLAFYAARFPSVEINYTFRSLPSAKAVATWRASTPETFVFAIKAHMRTTHARDAAVAETALALFLDAVAPLGVRTGPILFQFPPHLAFARDRLEPFLDKLRPGPRYVIECRNPSWGEARDLIASRGAGWCVAETDEDDAPDDALATGPFHYLRLRKARYTNAQVAAWAARIDAALAAGRDVYCYFRHEDTGTGPVFAGRLESALAAVRRGR